MASQVPQTALEDLLVAAALEPQRALLRSYLGKAYTERGDVVRAEKELQLARGLDPQDPVSRLYLALLLQQENRVNEAIENLEASREQTENRRLFRSGRLLEEDRAVQSANLAAIYRDAGLVDVSVREAARAVTYDYANEAAHLFLADSYNELRDPTRFNLRYETVWFNELLLANVLSPVGGGRLAQNVSQQEYSRLFQADGAGLANSTFYRSDNRSVIEQASQFATFGGTSYALDLTYEHSGGTRPNNDLDNTEWYTTIKQQVTPQDMGMLLVKYEDYQSGDNFQYYDPEKQARPAFRYEENQQPIVVGTWHHEWAPGMHTLILGGRLVTEQRFSDEGYRFKSLARASDGSLYEGGYAQDPFDFSYHGDFELYLAEVNQLFQWNRVSLSLGARYQPGTFETDARLTSVGSVAARYLDPAADSTERETLERVTGYGYLTLQPQDHLWLTAGLAYEDLTFPSNYRDPPLSSGTTGTTQLGPKAGLVWDPASWLTLRGAYTRSLGGVGEEESIRLEQTQVAGFPQTFRSLIPESVAGSASAPEFETLGAALDLKFPSRTYASIQVGRLNSDVDRVIGYFDSANPSALYLPSAMPEQLRYREDSVGATLHQLAGKYYAFGLSYAFTRSHLDDNLPEIPAYVTPEARKSNSAELQTGSLFVTFNHPSGLFARADATWYHQRNFGYTPPLPGEDFVQENLQIGYRFWHRRAEVAFGLLNLSDQDYHLNPLSPYLELPRGRAFMVRAKFIF